MNRVIWLYALILAAIIAVWAFAEIDGCTTDTECAAYCPPPGDDPDCDGGPQ